MKHFIITIDTEGDNLWKWKPGQEITTKNVQYLARFQELCSQYGFKPVWLSNWEMISDPLFVEFINRNVETGNCELGMHLHAWNNPPFYELPRDEHSGAPYLIEYPREIMEAKIAAITEKMKEQFGYVPVSHRAGRWAMNDTYFELLYQYGYRIDCSYTPGISWRDSLGQTPGFAGPDYRKASRDIQKYKGIVEVPVTVEYTHRMFLDKNKSWKSNVKTALFGMAGQNIWLRPGRDNMKDMLWMIEKNRSGDGDYLMFMLHSSELMPGGSPTFKDAEAVEVLYGKLQVLFDVIKDSYEGCTLEEYVKSKQ